MELTLGEIAVRFGCEIHGDPDASVDRVGTLAGAEAGCISFLANPGYRAQLPGTKATAVILAADDAPACNTHCVIAANPYAVYARVAQTLYPEAAIQPGIHPGAVIGADCVIGEGSEISAGAVLGNRVHLGDNCFVGPNCVLGDAVRVGQDSRLTANITLYQGVVLGERCLIHAGTVIGSDGFGIAPDDSGWIKVPQVGGVVIGDDVEIGANCCIDRGAIDNTRLGNDVKVDNLVQIAHNVVIGDHTALAGQVGIAGSATVGQRCIIGGSVCINGHIEIADDVSIMGRGNVTRSIAEPGVYSSVLGVEEAGKWRRVAARVKRLDAMAAKLRDVELAVKALQGNKGKD